MLRIVSFLVSLGLSSSAFAQDDVIGFSDGSDTSLGLSIPQALDDSARLGAAWEERLSIQGPDAFGRSIDMDELRERTMNHPRVRALLNADAGSVNPTEERQRYANQHAFMFASFSMPPASLKSMLREAEALNIPVLFRGFVNNSVYETQTAVETVFGDDEDVSGFNIDPTLFTRFDVEVVPTLVVVAEELTPCLTAGCEGDLAPRHDRLAGNIPLTDGLAIVAQGGGDANDQAAALLQQLQVGE